MDRSMAWTPHQAHHRRGHSLGGGGIREKDEDLALFKDMGKRDKAPTFLCSEDQLLDASLLTKFGGLSHPHSAPPVERKGIGAELLNSDADKTDYDWLMTPPGTPLFPSLDADSPALQHGTLINRSLAAIKTSRVGVAPRARSPAPNASRGNPSPSSRPSTPQNGPKSQLPSKSNPNNRPATPTRSFSTPTSSSRASPSPSPNVQPRPSTPTRQSTPARPVTPLGARPATPTRRTPGTRVPLNSGNSVPLNSGNRGDRVPSSNSTPTLRRSTSSPTAGRISNPSPTRSTASTATSSVPARGASPARSLPSRGVSPVRGVTPRGRSPSPSLRAPYPVDASDDIPPNLRTTSDRPSSAQRRAVAYGASPGEGRIGGEPLRRTPSPARSSVSGLSRTVESRASRAASSDSESSFDTCSQSGVSTFGLLTPERSGRMFGRGTVEYGRSSSLQQKVRRSSSPQLGPSASKKSFESAAREYHRGQVAAFRPLMTNSSISTFYSSRASGLLRRPLTPSSTASSSEHGATVAHDSEMDDEDAGSSHWKPSNAQASGAHSPLHLFDKSLRDAHDASNIVDDNDELSSFFRTPEALHVKSMDHLVTSHCKKDELFVSPELVSPELNWLHNPRNELHDDMETYNNLRPSKDNVDTSKSGLEQIRDKLRHLKSSNIAENNEEFTESAIVSRVHLQAAPSGTNCSTLRAPDGDKLRHLKSSNTAENNGDHITESAIISRQAAQSVTNCSPLRAPNGDNIMASRHDPMELIIPSCEVCGGGETVSQNCHCNATTTSLPLVSSAGESSNAETDSKAANMVYAKERDIWYIYRHSSEYEVPVAGFSETKMEISPPQILAKEVHMRANRPLNHDLTRVTEISSTFVSQSAEDALYSGKSGEYAESSRQKENVAMEKVSMEVPCGESNVAEGGNVATPGAALSGKLEVAIDAELAAIGADMERKGLEVGISEGGTVQSYLRKEETERDKQIQIILDEQCDNEESTQAFTSIEILCKPLHMSSEESPPQNSQMPAVQSSSRANMTMSTSFEAEKKPENILSGLPTSQGGGELLDYGDVHTADAQAQVSSFNSSRNNSVLVINAEEQGHLNWNEEHASVIAQVKKIIWQEEDLQPQCTVHSKLADEHERKGDEGELGWGNGKVEDMYFVGGYHLEGSVESQRQLAPTHGPNGVKPKTPRADDSASFFFEPLELVGQKYLLTGEIHIDAAVYATAHFSDDSLVIKVQSSDGRVLPLDNPARLISEPDDVNSFAVYEYSHWAEVGEQLTFSAHHGRDEENSSSEFILFYPREHHVHVTTGEKQPKIPEFQGRPVKRTVSRTPLDGVQITVVAEKDGGLKSGETAASSPPTSAGVHPSRQRNPDVLFNAPEACVMKATQSKPDVPVVFEGNNNTAKTSIIQELQVGNVITSHNGEFQQSNPKAVVAVVDQRLGASLDETTSTADHFDYIFESLGSKSNPQQPELMPGAGIFPNSAIVKPSSLNGFNQFTAKTNGIVCKGSEKQHTSKEKTHQSSITLNQSFLNPKSNSRADSELPVVVSTAPPVEAPPVKEEIVESAVSPNPTTRKHMSSFKFSHKKSNNNNTNTNAELKRSNTTKLGTQFGNGDHLSGTVNIPGSKKSMNTTKLSPLNGKPASPQLNKGRSVRAASPARPIAATNSAKAATPPHNSSERPHGDVPSEEPSIHSRFSNITVRSGSDTENFDWGPSSLEETSSRCGSSSSTNPASMAILSLSPNSSQALGYHEDMANGDHAEEDDDDEEEDEEEEQQQQVSEYSPVRRSANYEEISPGFQDTTVSSQSSSSLLNVPNGRRVIPNSSRDSSVVVNRVAPAATSGSVSNYAPKQNLDKLGEKLEQLETFGARVMLRNPEQQFLHSPPNSKLLPVDHNPPRHNLVAKSGNSSSTRSHHNSYGVRLQDPAGRSGTYSAMPASSQPKNKCRCTIL